MVKQSIIPGQCYLTLTHACPGTLHNYLQFVCHLLPINLNHTNLHIILNKHLHFTDNKLEQTGPTRSHICQLIFAISLDKRQNGKSLLLSILGEDFLGFPGLRLWPINSIGQCARAVQGSVKGFLEWTVVVIDT